VLLPAVRVCVEVLLDGLVLKGALVPDEGLLLEEGLGT